jgi:hypothetical protein
MIQIIIANKQEHAGPIRELFREYLQWANAKVEENFGVSFNIATMLEEDMNMLDKFMPPKGRLLLGYVDDVAFPFFVVPFRKRRMLWVISL